MIGQQLQAIFTQTGSEPNDRLAQPLFCDALECSIFGPFSSLLTDTHLSLHSTCAYANTTFTQTAINYRFLFPRKPQIWRLENGVRHVPRVRARRIAAHGNSTSPHMLTAVQQTTKSRRAARRNLPLPPSLLPAAASLKMRKTIAMCVSPRYPALHNFAPPCTKDAHTDYNSRS
jgi:hypothetical protein